MRLLLIRHTAPALPPGICYGRLDVAATEASRDQWLHDWDAGVLPGQPWQGYRRLLSSPAQRCQVLAQALAARLALPVTRQACWQELDFGTWEGQTWADIGHDAVNAWAADIVHGAPGDGESLFQMMQRVVVGYAAWRAAGEDAILVCHGGTIRLLQAWHQEQAPCISVAEPVAAIPQAPARPGQPVAGATDALVRAIDVAQSTPTVPVGGVVLLATIQ